MMSSQVIKLRSFNHTGPIQSTCGKSNNIHWLLCVSVVLACVNFIIALES